MKVVGPLIVASVLASMGFLACVGDDPSSSSGVQPADGGGIDASGTAAEGGSVEPDASHDAPLDCKAPMLACGSACVDPVSSDQHCGRCDHSCGGGVCVEGACKESTFRAGLNAKARLAVGEKDVFFTDGMAIRKCPVGGCTTAPATVIQFTMYDLPSSNATLLASKDTILFQGSRDKAGTQWNGFFYCPASGCTSALPSNFGDSAYFGISAFVSTGASDADIAFFTNNNGNESLRTSSCDNGACTTAAELLADGTFVLASPAAMAMDATNVYWVNDNAGTIQVMSVPRSGGTVAPIATLTSATSMKHVAIVARAGRVYVARSNGNYGEVLGCQAGSGCAPVASTLRPMQFFVADATSFYAASDQYSTLYTCPLTGCGSGPKLLVEHMTDPGWVYKDLAVRDGLVYWIEGAPGSSTIKRIAVP